MFTRFVDRFHAWRQRRVAIAHLRHLDSRILADMGTSYGSIHHFVDNHACPKDRQP